MLSLENWRHASMMSLESKEKKVERQWNYTWLLNVCRGIMHLWFLMVSVNYKACVYVWYQSLSLKGTPVLLQGLSVAAADGCSQLHSMGKKTHQLFAYALIYFSRRVFVLPRRNLSLGNDLNDRVGGLWADLKQSRREFKISPPQRLRQSCSQTSRRILCHCLLWVSPVSFRSNCMHFGPYTGFQYETNHNEETVCVQRVWKHSCYHYGKLSQLSSDGWGEYYESVRRQVCVTLGQSCYVYFLKQ